MVNLSHDYLGFMGDTKLYIFNVICRWYLKKIAGT